MRRALRSVFLLSFLALASASVASNDARAGEAGGAPKAPPKGNAGGKKDPAPPPKVEAPAPPPPNLSGATRWVDPTPDDMVQSALKRASGNYDDGVAGLLLALSMTEHASQGSVARGLASLGKAGTSDVGYEAGVLALALTPPAFGELWQGWGKISYEVPREESGIVKAFVVTGPLQDMGGGLGRQEGPEASDSSFAELDANYSWGDFEVKPRRALPGWVTASGLQLDTYVFPRTESCSYVSSKVVFDDSVKEVVVRVASSGSARVIWDGQTVAFSEDVHPRALLDRMAAKIELGAGAHLVAVKVCSSAIADEGRVRVRFTDAAGKPLAVTASSDLRGLDSQRVKGLPLPAALVKKPAAPPPPPPSGKPAKGPGKPDKGKQPPAKQPPAEPTAPAPTGLKFTELKTPLARALDISDSAPIDLVVVAAIARSLGGADDTRSPKAPGLLDRIAKSPTASADQLALAGWLSAFGANKSAWLNKSIELGTASGGDSRAAAFAQRRLAESLLIGGAVDSVMRLMERDPLKSATDIPARLLRASITGRTRSQLDAFREVQAIDDETKQSPPRAVLTELTSLSMTFPEKRLGYLRRLAQESNSGRDMSLVWATDVEGAGAFERAVASVIPYNGNPRSLVSMSNALRARQRYAWARELAYVATKLGPNIPDTWEALAAAREAIVMDETARGATPTDDLRYAQQARQRSLDLRRGDASKKAEIAYRDGVYEGAKSEVKEKGEDERFLHDSASILARAKATPAKPGEEFERLLHFQRVVTYHPDKRVSQLIHQAREIVVEPRTNDELYERQVQVEGDEVELVFARVHRKDGTVVAPDEQSTVGAYIKWPQLKAGDIVEFAVRSWTSQPVGRRGDPPWYFIDYVGSTTTRPTLFNEVIVDSPENSQLGTDVINGKAEKVDDQVVNGRRIVKYTWEHPRVIAEEPLSPAPTEVFPIVIGSTFRSWDDFRTWYRDAIEGFSEPDDQVKRLAADLTKDKKTEQEKLEAIFNYVADDIRYVNYTSGEYWLPNRPQQLLARKQGDCDDKATLLIALLKSIGITPTPVLVQTRLTAMPSVLMGTTAAVPFFDHGIAYLPGKNGKPGMWLDATSPQSRIGPLPSMDARAKALFVYDGEAKIVDTPQGDPNDNGVSLTWTVKLDAEGGAEVTAAEKHIGDWAFELRNNLIEVDARHQWVEQYLRRYAPTVDLGPNIDYSPNAGTLDYTVNFEGFSRVEGDEIAVPTMGSFSFMATYASLAKRTLPIVLPPYLAPGHQRRSVTLEAPAGFTFKELPPGGEAKGGPFGTIRVSFKQGGSSKGGKGASKTPANSVLVETEVVFDKSTISVDEYPAFRQWLQSADALVRQAVRLVRAPAASSGK
ncbi:MAG: transglutaminase-like domain-containing protein [Polyangiaceae bacterium]